MIAKRLKSELTNKQWTKIAPFLEKPNSPEQKGRDKATDSDELRERLKRRGYEMASTEFYCYVVLLPFYLQITNIE